MIAYKGFTKDLTATMGSGTFQFKAGETYEEKESKTIRSGFHCCENPFECLTYYPLGRDNRYFRVEAAGSIDEDGGERIACTRLTLLKELTLKEFAGYGMLYMCKHPLRTGWQQSHTNMSVKEDEAVGTCEGYIAIARGPEPRVKGKHGSILGLILEPEPGNIEAARLFVVTGDVKEDTWYTLTEERTLQVMV